MGNLKIEMFHEDKVQLNLEVQKHPDLMKLLANHPAGEYEIQLAEIAGYCGIALHGDYLPSDLDRLCGLLVKKLMEKRLPLILSSSGPIIAN